MPALMTSNRVLDDDQLREAAPSVFAASPWHAMSGRYKFVPTIEVLGMLADKGFRPVKAGQARTRIEGKGDFTRHLIRLRHESYLTPAVVDAEVPELVLANSHDGTSAYKFMSGIFRLVCENGMIVEIGRLRLDLGPALGRPGLRREGARRHLYRHGSGARALDRIAGWKHLQLDAPQRLAFASAAAELRDHAAITGANLIGVTRRLEDRASDLWTVANRVQENLMRGGLTGRHPETRRHTTTQPVKSVSEDLRLNRAIWTLTEKMAELVYRGDARP